TSVFQIWQSVPPPSSSYLPAHGMCGVLHGVRMLLSMDRAAAFTVLGMPAKHGPVSTATGSLKATGDASASKLRRTASACTRSFRRKNPASIVPTMEATLGCSCTAVAVLPVEHGTSIVS